MENNDRGDTSDLRQFIFHRGNAEKANTIDGTPGNVGSGVENCDSDIKSYLFGDAIFLMGLCDADGTGAFRRISNTCDGIAVFLRIDVAGGYMEMVAKPAPPRLSSLRITTFPQQFAMLVMPCQHWYFGDVADPNIPQQTIAKSSQCAALWRYVFFPTSAALRIWIMDVSPQDKSTMARIAVIPAKEEMTVDRLLLIVHCIHFYFCILIQILLRGILHIGGCHRF